MLYSELSKEEYIDILEKRIFHLKGKVMDSEDVQKEIAEKLIRALEKNKELEKKLKDALSSTDQQNSSSLPFSEFKKV